MKKILLLVILFIPLLALAEEAETDPFEMPKGDLELLYYYDEELIDYIDWENFSAMGDDYSDVYLETAEEDRYDFMYDLIYIISDIIFTDYDLDFTDWEEHEIAYGSVYYTAKYGEAVLRMDYKYYDDTDSWFLTNIDLKSE